MSIFAPLEKHPFILIGGVVAVLLLWQLKGSSHNAVQPATLSGADPALTSLAAAQLQTAAATNIAGINANSGLGQTKIMADVANTQTSTQADVMNHQAILGANVMNGQSGAGIFATAAEAITANYELQLQANGANVSGSSSQSGSSTGSGGTAGSGVGFNVNSNSNYSSVANPAGSASINTANTQIEEMFNNILRSGAGQSVMQTALITTPSVSVAPAPVPIPMSSGPDLAPPMSSGGAWSGNGSGGWGYMSHGTWSEM